MFSCFLLFFFFLAKKRNKIKSQRINDTKECVVKCEGDSIKHKSNELQQAILYLQFHLNRNGFSLG